MPEDTTPTSQAPAHPTRVLHLLTSMTGAGCGIVNAAIDLISGQLRLGLEVAVCAGEGEFTSFLDEHNVTFIALNQTRTFLNLIRAVRRLKQIIREYKPDIVHCHMMTSVVLARIVRATSTFRIVAHLHNVHQRSSDLMGLADHVIAVSGAVREDMVRRGTDPNKLTVVHNGMIGSMRLTPPEKEEPANLCQPAIVTVGGMNHRKGISELIEAFDGMSANISDHHLYLVGDGPEMSLFKAQAASMRRCDFIHFVGFQANPIPYMKAAKLFVLASRRESFGLVLTEARQCGCAIVATNVDGIPEALDNGEAGLLVPVNDVGALRRGMSSVLDNQELRGRLELKARENLDRFTVERMAAETNEVYTMIQKAPVRNTQ